MYIVEWTDHEGNLHQVAFEDQVSAQLEADGLRQRFDYVAVIWETDV